MIRAKIHNIINSLTQTEQRIARYILENPHSVVNMTVNELANKCATVPSAVNRMCKSIGIQGFSKLKIELAGEINSTGSEDFEAPLAENDTPELIFGKVFYSGINALKNTYNMLDFAVVKKIAEIISSANRVFLFGLGTSAVVAMDASYRFSQLGVQAYVYTDILQMNVMAKNMKNNDVAFIISHSGTTRAVVDAMKSAKNAGAQTIGLTSFSKSIVYRECNHSICVYADEINYPVEAVSARIVHMCVIDALVMSVASMDYNNYLKHISMRNEVLNKIRY